ncbi:DUF934 domain-containing protein [uncultured Sphingomonas sp.]|uniref:DUF934 domain-containing protein n=1 Tax=uncultured Sphingomonas sp. TaxID=158754 RepID=UPI0035C9AA68
MGESLSGDEPDQGEAVATAAVHAPGARPLRFRDDELHEEHAVPLDAFLVGGANAGAVHLAPGDDARALLPHLGRLRLVEIAFPSFRDGRGYSAARVLREGGYTGELRAAGDVLVDQLPFMRRCGFDSFAPDAPIDAAVLERSLARYPTPYQGAADAGVPVWKLRHG